MTLFFFTHFENFMYYFIDLTLLKVIFTTWFAIFSLTENDWQGKLFPLLKLTNSFPFTYISLSIQYRIEGSIWHVTDVNQICLSSVNNVVHIVTRKWLKRVTTRALKMIPKFYLMFWINTVKMEFTV